MQVSQIAEQDTHAIIGGGKAKAFEMSASAEFFTVLSDTLYRDKKRAVVREVICNAWDAHIMVGKIDQPIEITLTDDEMVIKDFGPGIADNKMHGTYCIFGGTTKIADEKQTGGFGLGCKAPFAYSDHFSVTSCHAGTRTVYAISRGGPETAGVPDMRAMVSVPTVETGLTVSIPLKSQFDRKEFEKLIRNVVQGGGMLATLNGEALNRFDYEPARKQGYCYVAQRSAEGSIYVLYGTVLYPLSASDVTQFPKRSELGQLVPNNGMTILIAPPNSVGVTPSREALSYTDKTVATINGLIARAVGQLKHAHKNALKKVILRRAKEQADRIEEDRRVSPPLETHAYIQSGIISTTSLSTQSISLGSIKTNYVAPLILVDPTKIAMLAIEARTLNSSVLLRGVLKASLGRFRDLRSGIRRAIYGKTHRNHQLGDLVTLFEGEARRKLLIRTAAKFNLLPNLQIGTASRAAPDITEFFKSDRHYNRSARNLRNTVIFSATKRDLRTKLKDVTGLTGMESDHHWDFSRRSMAVFVIPRLTEERAEELRKAFGAKGFKVVTVMPEKQPKREAPAEPLFRDAAKTWCLTVSEGKPTLAKPQHYLHLRSDHTHILTKLSGLEISKVAKYYPKCALVIGPRDHGRVIKGKVKNVLPLMLNDLEKLAKTRDGSLGIARAQIHLGGRYSTSTSIKVNSLIDMDDKVARLLLGVPFAVTERYRRAELLTKVLTACFDDKRLMTVEQKDMDRLMDLKALAKRDNTAFFVSEPKFESHYAYLRLLDVNNVERADAAALVPLIQQLQRLHARNKTASTPEPETTPELIVEPLKEAA